MKDTNLIPDSCNALLSSFYNPSCKSSTNLYHTLDQAQLIQRNDLKSRSTPKNLARNQPEEILLKTRPNQEFIDRSAITPEKFAATSAITKNSGVYDRNRATHHKILAQRDRHKSDQAGTIDTRQNENATIGQENPKFAPSRQRFALRTKHETLTGISLRAFLPEFAVRTWGASANRCSLEKSAQTETRSPQADSYQERDFWQWVEPPPDIPINILEGAAFLKKGGAE